MKDLHKYIKKSVEKTSANKNYKIVEDENGTPHVEFEKGYTSKDLSDAFHEVYQAWKKSGTMEFKFYL